MPRSAKSIIQEAWQKISANNPVHQDTWLCDETILRLLQARYTKFPEAITLNRKAVNGALTPLAGPFDKSNLLGFYHADFKTKCPYNDNARRMVHYYYTSVLQEPPSKPYEASDVEDIIAKTHTLRKNRERVAAAEKERNNNDEIGKALEEQVAENEKKKQSAKEKKQSTTDNQEQEKQSSSPRVGASPSEGANSEGSNNNSPPSNNRNNIYWQSPEAKKLFGFTDDLDDPNAVVDVVQSLQDRINLLRKVNATEDGFQLVIPWVVGSNEKNNYVSSHNKFTIRQKSLFLLRAYEIALEKMCVGVKWLDVCKEACLELNAMGFLTTKSGKTIGDWNRYFRQHEKFPHPNAHVRMGKKPKPALFEVFPTLEAAVNEFIMLHLDCFTVEMLRGELITNMIPKFMKEVEEDGEIDSVAYHLLENYTEHPPSISSILCWVHTLGFSYSTKRKSYMVDGHEHEEQRKHRKEFTAEYLTVLEKRSHRWIQILKTEFDAMKACTPGILASGYTYTAIDGRAMIEFHVDDHECMKKLANEKYEFGGNISVRCSGKPIIIIGQDESVYNQFAFGCKQWVGKSGERAFLPKSGGAGVMISAFQSREFGWGLAISADQLEKINEKRMRDGEYFDKVAAKDVLDKTKKHKLTESPFIRKLWYGSNNEGYWTGNHMIVQLEDCMDCLQVLYADAFEFVFMFDHSSGHAKKRVNGLDADKMNCGSGGIKQHPTLIKEKEGFLGPYHDPTN
ncbi:hypothetical protein ACHAXR_003180, partial [Thalassiosira sp. AJA248-18]